MSHIEISKKLVLINSASSAVVLVLNLSVLLWLQQYLLKRISPDEYALLPVVMAVMAFSPLLTMVLTGGLGRYITVAYARGDNEEITRICSTMFPLLLAGGTAFLAIGWFVAWHINVILKIKPEYLADARIMMALLVFSAAIRLPLAVFGSGFLVRQKLMLHDSIVVGCQLLRIAVLFILLLVIGTSVLWVTVATVVSELAYLAISTPVSIRLVPSQRIIWRGCFLWPLAQQLTSYGSWGLVSQIAETIKQAFDPFVLNRFASALDVSVFYVAGIAPRQLRLMLGPISRPFLPVLASMHATGDFIRLRNTYLRMSRYHSWVLLAVGVPGIVFSQEVMHLYLDGKYDDAGGIMAILLFVAVLGGFNGLGPAIVAAVSDLREFSLRILSVYAMNLVLTIIAVVYLEKGAYGAATSTLVAVTLLEVTIVWPYCRRVSHVSTHLWIREVIVPSVGPAVLPLFVCLAVKMTIGIDSWSALLSVALLCTMLYLFSVANYGLRQQDRLDIGRVAVHLPGPLRRMAEYLAKY